jgi:hypothetical protein
MGKSVQIVARTRPRVGYLRFEIDRSLTGTGHESYEIAPLEECDRPTDVLARSLFATGLVKRVHIFSNVITITLQPQADVATSREGVATVEESEQEKLSQQDDLLQTVVEQLFVHYRPGVLPTPV